ncbi:hypothetical protein RJT34_29362 [Clitoria ternatea]|uniref:NB-ARC domain-containing protein n=1 Tax=Clitoria ternatea TaxID=43366 RepID=A0AAN9FAF9_CLITE
MGCACGMKELARQVKEDGSFGVVVVATITDSPNLEKIQGPIANALDLKFNKETKEERAGLLRIREEKSILVVLDDIWDKLDLVQVGIPRLECKLMLVSRDRNVLNRQMGTQKCFRLEILSEEDSWCLFEKIVGDIEGSNNIKPVAEKVAKSCAGLPLLIVTMANALRKKKVSAWDDALHQLERYKQDGILEKVCCTMDWSYHHLGSRA